MEYDKWILKSWSQMESWDEFLERNGAFKDYVSREGFKHLERKYFKEVKRRIAYCKKLLTEHDDACIYHTLAELYDRGNLDDSVEHLYKRPVRYYCIKAIRKNPDYAPTWALLSEAYIWIVALGGESKEMPRMDASVDEQDIIVDIERQGSSNRRKPTMFFIERATKCLKKAIAIDPQREYLYRLKEFYGLKAEELEENNC
ncbi:hypothetical protein ACFL2J_00150 [Candidatus Omnitrophota bacterium]